MANVHSKIFHAAEDDEEDDDDEEGEIDDATKSIVDVEPTQENVDMFLDKVKYTDDELDQFYFLVERGLNIDQASDMVFQRRLNLMEEKGIKVSHHFYFDIFLFLFPYWTQCIF